MSAHVPLVAGAAQLYGVLKSLPQEKHPLLFQKTLQILNTQDGFDYEKRALAAGKAWGLYQKFGRLLGVLTPHADSLYRDLGISTPEVNSRDGGQGFDPYHAWGRLMAGGQTLVGTSASYDPAGALAGVFYYMDRRGVAAHYAGRVEKAPASFGFFPPGRGDDSRLERYNDSQKDWDDHLKDVSLQFPDALRRVMVPEAYRDLLRESSRIQFVAPVSEALGGYDLAWARSLPKEAVIVSGMKGLYEGQTPLEYFDKILRAAGRTDVLVVDVLGYLPAERLMEEQRKVAQGLKPSGSPWKIVLTSKFPLRAKELALRWAGPDAEVVEHELGETEVPVITVKSRSFATPLEITIVCDKEVIQANEQASVYKNLQAIHLGNALFEEMVKYVRSENSWNPSLQQYFTKFYADKIDQAKKDILEALEVGDIPESKRFILEAVLDDLYGSWRTQSFEDLYNLVQQIFAPQAKKEDWAEGIILLKQKIGRYYSVRNPRYGFCAAGDRAAALAGRWLSREDVEAAVERLKKKELLKEGQEPAILDSLHFFFSMIPDGLNPEGLQIAQQLFKRYGKKLFAKLPDSFRKTHLLVERMQQGGLFAPEVHERVIDISKRLAFVFDKQMTREKYLETMAEVGESFKETLSLLNAGQHVFSGNIGKIQFVSKLVQSWKDLQEKLKTNPKITNGNLSLLNQAVLEVLTLVNLFYILPPQDSHRAEKLLMERLDSLSRFASSETFDDLFPAEENELAGLDMKDSIVPLRKILFEAVGESLISLTYEMNKKLYQDNRVIQNKQIIKSLETIHRAMTGVKNKVDDQAAQMVFEQFIGWLQEGKDTSRKFTPDQRLLIYEALIDTLIHMRRFIVFPEDKAFDTLVINMKRFRQIFDFIEGKSQTPLWHFGENGKLKPGVD